MFKKNDNLRNEKKTLQKTLGAASENVKCKSYVYTWPIILRVVLTLGAWHDHLQPRRCIVDTNSIN